MSVEHRILCAFSMCDYDYHRCVCGRPWAECASVPVGPTKEGKQ